MRILFIGMLDSIHVARWIDQMRSCGWDLRLFPAYQAPICPELRGVTVYNYAQVRPREAQADVRFVGSWPGPAGAVTFARKLVKRIRPGWDDRAQRLAREIEKFKPDVVHSLEIQHAGYLTLEARKLLPRFPTWIVTNYGSDIYLFGQLAEHAPKIREVLAACDVYACECQRDVGLAREFGFAGVVWPVLPNGGGFDLQSMAALRAPGPVSARRTIALKGYTGWAGRALVGIKAIELCADVLRGYRVAVYLAGEDVKIAAELVARATGLKIDLVPRCSHDQMLRLHGESRVSIGLSISDGISTSALEALVMGSFPIQSCGSCADEWYVDGVSGMKVPAEDPHAVAAALRRAITDDALVDAAAELNARVAAERLDRSVIAPQVIESYDRIARRNRSG